MKHCHAKVGVDPGSVRYIEVDGYATKWADSFEFEGVKNALKLAPAAGKRCALGSVNGNIGNVEAASAVTHVVKLVLAMRHQMFPATISMQKISSYLDIDSPEHPLYVADRPLAFADIRDGDEPIRAGVNSFADSGTHVHILLEEHLPEPRAGRGAAAPVRLFVLSARDGARLQVQVAQYLAHVATMAAAPTELFADLAYTLQCGRAAHAERLAIEASTATELADKLRWVGEAGARDLAHLESHGIYRGSAAASETSRLAGLISAEMAGAQVTRSARVHEWRPVALMWVHGVEVPWRLAWAGVRVVPAALPGYPFARQRHWFAFESSGAPPAPSAAPAKPTGLPAIPPTSGPSPVMASIPGNAADANVEPERGPRKLAACLQQEVSDLLGHPVDDRMLGLNLLDLGLSSIGIAALIGRIDDLLGIHLAPSTVFQHPDLLSLAAHLATRHPTRTDGLVEHRSAGTASNPFDVEPTTPRPRDILVVIQREGGRTPLVAIPGAGGSALSMHLLSHAPGPAQPFLCLEPVGLDGACAPLVSVEETARLNVERLMALPAPEPYRLLGYSNGGVVAFEMARQLMGRGAMVASLAMIDALCPPLHKERPFEEMTVAVFNHFARSLGVPLNLEPGALREIAEVERSRHLYDCLVARGVTLPWRQFLATFEVATASERACRAHLPRRLPRRCDVQLFKAADARAAMPEDMGWGRYVRGPLRTHPVPGDHCAMLERGAVLEIATHLQPSSPSCPAEAVANA